VAAGGTLGERLFALNDNGDIYFNYGDGCDANWVNLGSTPPGYGKPVEIAAADAKVLYVIDEFHDVLKFEVFYAGSYLPTGSHCDASSGFVSGRP
jgi:hypothetical protein